MDDNQVEKFLPIWMWIIVLLQVFLVLAFSIGTFMNPGDFIPGISEINYVTQLYITRNVTIALGLILAAIILRSHQALLVLLLIRLITDISDIITVYLLNVDSIKSSVPAVIVLLVLPAFVAIFYLLKRKS